jgi:hypothetical protein
VVQTWEMGMNLAQVISNTQNLEEDKKYRIVRGLDRNRKVVMQQKGRVKGMDMGRV